MGKSLLRVTGASGQLISKGSYMHVCLLCTLLTTYSTCAVDSLHSQNYELTAIITSGLNTVTLAETKLIQYTVFIFVFLRTRCWCQGYFKNTETWKTWQDTVYIVKWAYVIKIEAREPSVTLRELRWEWIWLRFVLVLCTLPSTNDEYWW